MLTGRLLSILILSGAACSPDVHAALPVAGWGYSVGNLFWGILPWNNQGAGWWDPPAGTILSGRVTLRFDPSYYQITGYGWFGDFGVDPSIPAPAVISDFLTVDPAWAATWNLQAPNPAMTQSVAIDNSAGIMVVDFDWGPSGYTPPTNDHFNFFGYTYSLPSGMTNAQLQLATTGPFGPGKMAISGSPQDVAANGTDAQTYMLCTSGFCGASAIPEPSRLAMTIIGLIAAGAVFNTKRKRIV